MLFGDWLRSDLHEPAHTPPSARIVPAYPFDVATETLYRYAQNLAKVQQAYNQLGEIETWETLIAELREEHKRLPALKDELNKAGL